MIILEGILWRSDFFSDPVRVLSIGLNPIQVLLIRSDPVRVLSIRSHPIRSDPVQVLLTPRLDCPFHRPAFFRPGSSFIILPRASLFVGRVGRFKLYCCLVGKLFCHVVKKFRRCKLSKPEESVCHFWTLYINQIVFCFERFAMFDRTDPLWSQIKSAQVPSLKFEGELI